MRWNSPSGRDSSNDPDISTFDAATLPQISRAVTIEGNDATLTQLRRNTVTLIHRPFIRSTVLLLALLLAPLLGSAPAARAASVTPQISAGSGHTCALRTNGTVVCWGFNTDGISTPPADLAGVTNIGAGIFITCAVKSDGTVACWGSTTRFGGTPPAGLTGVTQVSTSFARACAVKSDGTVVCWGSDAGLGANTPPAGLTGVIQISVGEYGTCALKNDGTVVCWGDSSFTPPAGLTGVKQLDTGYYNVCAVKSDSTVICWGDNTYNASTPPAGLTGVTQVSAGGYFGCALKNDSTVVCWSTYPDNRTVVPAGLTGVVQISVGDNHTCALKNDGTVVCWGSGSGVNVPAGLDLDNQSPTAVSLAPTSVAENQPVGTTVGAFTTTDPDAGDAFAYTLVSGTGSADNSQFTIEGNTLKTAASFDFETKSSYTVRVRSTDRNGAFAEQSFTISVSDVVENVAPVANNDTASTDEDTPVTISVLANDTDADGNRLTPSIVSGSSNGQAVVNADGTITYTPNANYNGPDSFTYKANDGTVDSNVAKVSITVNAVNDAPVAQNDSATTNEDTPVTVNVLTNDSDTDGALDPSSVTVTGAPSKGTTSVNAATGAITYTPNANANGFDSLIYSVCDTGTPLPAKCATATVNITITPVNDAPVAVADSYSTNEDTTLTVAARGVLTNDTDVDTRDTRTAVLVSGPSHAASFTLNDDGSFVYTPALNYNGPDSFSYKLRDAAGAESAPVTVALTVNAVNDAPTLALAANTCAAPNTPTGSFHLSLADVDSTSLSLSATSSNTALVPQSGITFSGSGASRTVTIAAKTASGMAVVTLMVSDGQASTQQTITVKEGTSNNETLTGTNGADLIFAQGGEDTVNALDGVDLVCGGSGNDVLNGGAGDDALSGQNGDDRLDGEAGNDTLTGGASADRFDGGADTDTITDFNPSEGDTKTNVP